RRHARLVSDWSSDVCSSDLYATLPFFAAGLGWLWVRERVSPTTILASAVAAAGVLIMVSGTTLSGHLDGDALALLQTASMAVGGSGERRVGGGWRAGGSDRA